jgi:hypothetical protein
MGSEYFITFNIPMGSIPFLGMGNQMSGGLLPFI